MGFEPTTLRDSTTELLSYCDSVMLLVSSYVMP